MSVQYIARITCACGATVDVSCFPCMETDRRGRDIPAISVNEPADWLGGYDDDHPYTCPACVEKRYA